MPQPLRERNTALPLYQIYSNHRITRNLLVCKQRSVKPPGKSLVITKVKTTISFDAFKCFHVQGYFIAGFHNNKQIEIKEPPEGSSCYWYKSKTHYLISILRLCILASSRLAISTHNTPSTYFASIPFSSAASGSVKERTNEL